MKRWKVFFACSLALIMIFQAGCSSSKTSSEDVVTLSFWDFHSESQKDFFADLVKEYNASQDNVKIEFKSFNQSDYGTTKLPVAFANGEGPDIFMVNPGDFLKFADAGILADLNPYFPEGVKEDFLPASIEAVTYEDKVLALPYELELLALFYNKDMLADAGVEVPKTWDELSSAAEKLTTDEVAGLILPTDKATYLNFIWYPFLWQQGGSVLTEDKTASNFDSPEVVKALDYWGSFFQEGSSPAKLQRGPWEIGHVGEETAAMQIVGTWDVPALEREFPDVNVGVAPIPIPEGGKQATAAGGYKFAVNSKSEHVEEAAKFVMWAFGDEDTSHALEWCTDVKFAYSPRKSVIEAGQETYNSGLQKVFTDEIYETAIPEPSFNAKTVDIIGTALQEVMFGDVSGEDAAKKAHEKINESLGN
ncbi:sugar ABC transporter substrate-binding protein [Alkalihalobacillus sp. AL-G]|uniref:ABC transporter substrate-binding protein n=1 Tax=Alkalihalobacillus sp. AL-G TaxID=2926399 RepID=UPI00272C8A09|nr:sugar ABC transporter substrate-binding protein [Alkalihalobacillus sp. AL-G]WLD93844.1 sugar ABC transporter substrate-binding protein [Alkalihalobacillus sp. AL-G]